MKYIALFTPGEPAKTYKDLKRKPKNASQRPFYGIQKILSSTQKNLLIQGLETIDLGLEITE